MPSASAPFSYKKYTANGSDTSFAIDFDFLDSSHLSVTIDGVTQDTSLYTYNSSTNAIVFTTAPTNGEVIVIERTTPKGKAAFQSDVVNFVDNSVLTAADLDKGFEGILYISQEANDSGSVNALSLDKTDDVWDAENKRIKNLNANPSAGRDAVTKDYVDNLSLYGATTSPQSWVIEPTEWTALDDGSGDFNVTLGSGPTSDDPTPLTDDANMFFVEVEGVLQKPTTDYTVVSIDEVYTLTLLGQGTRPTQNVHVRNLGLARNVFASTVLGDISFDTDTLHVDSTNDRVGINTTTPQRSLEVKETGDSLIRVEGGVGNAAGVEFINTGKDGTQLYSTDENLHIFTNNAERMRVQSDGKVGIGTSAPQNPLHLNASDSSSNYIQLTNSTTGSTSGDGAIVGLSSAELLVLANQESNDITLQTAGSDRVRVKADGKVGIGTSNPTSLLEVSSSGNSIVTLSTTANTEKQIRASGGTNKNFRLVNEIPQSYISFDVNTDTSGTTTTPRVRVTTNGMHFANGATTGTLVSPSTGLDYYAEGTFTPTFTLGTTVGLEGDAATAGTFVFTGGSNKLAYTRIGNLVTLTGQLSIASGYSSGGSTVKINNLPYTVKNGGPYMAAGSIERTTSGGASVLPAIRIIHNSKILQFGHRSNSTGMYSTTASGYFRTGDVFVIHASYMAIDTEE